jgi:predicted nucleic acid-binding protein
MPERSPVLVSNTTPLIALAAATGSLDVLRAAYARVVVPWEVAQEVQAGGRESFGLDAFHGAQWLDIQPAPVTLQPFLQNSLDRGEASVIQTAMNLGVPLACIDETTGRRVARQGYPLSMPDALQRMRAQGIWLSERVIQWALAQAGEG